MAFVMAFLIIIPKILCIVPKKKRNKKRDKEGQGDGSVVS